MASEPIIHIVDDDKSFRTGIARLLKVSNYDVAEYESAEYFLQTIGDARPGCIVLDLQMPTLTGLQLQEELQRLSHSWPIIFLSGHGDIPSSVRAIKGGAQDFLTKPVRGQILLEAIECAFASFAETLRNHDQLNHFKYRVSMLTPRESEVFALMVRGKLNKQIAFQLGASERTIKAHRHKVMYKLQVQSFAEAVSIAERIGLLAPLTTLQHST